MNVIEITVDFSHSSSENLPTCRTDLWYNSTCLSYITAITFGTIMTSRTTKLSLCTLGTIKANRTRNLDFGFRTIKTSSTSPRLCSSIGAKRAIRTWCIRHGHIRTVITSGTDMTIKNTATTCFVSVCSCRAWL